ncbi:MAG: hypothetical protein RBQ94_03015 [Methanimicrococcus sp.]|nr:hypothetical protein [Methanimicrococcus sp.]
MSEKSSSSFSARKYYAIVAVGLIIFSLCAVFSYASHSKIESGELSPEDLASQKKIYAVTKIGSMVGFIIALVPSVLILQKTLQEEKEKLKTSSDLKESNKEEKKE